MISQKEFVPAKYFTTLVSTIVNDKDIPDDAFRKIISNSLQVVEGGFQSNDVRERVKVVSSI